MPLKISKTGSMSDSEAKATSKSTLDASMLAAFRDIVQEVIQQENNGLREEIKRAISPIKGALDECHDKLHEHEEGLNNLDERTVTVEKQYENLSRDYRKLQEKIDDPSGVPEGLEKGNPTQFIAGLLHDVLWGRSGLEEAPILDRAHRATAQTPREGDRPRLFIVRVHYFQEKERIQHLTRQKGRLEFQGKQILIFPDYSADLTKRRAVFNEVKELLRKQDGIRYGLLYPARLRISFDGQVKVFENPQTTKD
uniref:L1 transposable element RRM domain-containing protein n=1 Tax=Acanthochromis polyacanthus TaxID=80966 RepID=A0A3Q1FHV7_9TELE